MCSLEPAKRIIGMQQTWAERSTWCGRRTNAKYLVKQSVVNRASLSVRLTCADQTGIFILTATGLAIRASPVMPVIFGVVGRTTHDMASGIYFHALHAKPQRKLIPQELQRQHQRTYTLPQSESGRLPAEVAVQEKATTRGCSMSWSNMKPIPPPSTR